MIYCYFPGHLVFVNISRQKGKDQEPKLSTKPQEIQ